MSTPERIGFAMRHIVADLERKHGLTGPTSPRLDGDDLAFARRLHAAARRALDRGDLARAGFFITQATQLVERQTTEGA